MSSTMFNFCIIAVVSLFLGFAISNVFFPRIVSLTDLEIQCKNHSGFVANNRCYVEVK